MDIGLELAPARGSLIGGVARVGLVNGREERMCKGNLSEWSSFSRLSLIVSMASVCMAERSGSGAAQCLV
jgi:hypothetical protein